jgi:predicted enzyme related to lactoylglutathione lyase
MVLGLRTVIYPAPDLAAAKAWYARALWIEPYFDEPFYVGFEVGGHELGLHPQADPAAGVLAYWGVQDARAAHAALLEQGATPRDPVTDVGGGILTATVLDPSGAVLGIIENPHFRGGA